MERTAIGAPGKSRTSRRARSRGTRSSPVAHQRLAWPVRLLLISLFIPWTWHLGPLALSMHRTVLLIMVVPCLVAWISGKAGRVRASDITLLLYCLWASVSLMVNQGLDGSIQPAGILFIETAGSYFIARCYIRNADDFRRTVHLLFWLVVALLPFAILEAVTHRDVLLQAFSAVLPVPTTAENDPRLGLRRVQAVFEHPILFGVVASSVFALSFLVLGYGEKGLKRWMRPGSVFVTAFFSLSAGPLTALIGQGMLLSWNWLLSGYVYRWRLLCGLLATAWVSLSMVSNRSVPNLFLSMFSFDGESAYYRILIWIFGTRSALDNPFFGVGLNRWERPVWMPPSIDMFWLIHAVYYGIPAAILMLLTLIIPFFSIGFLKISDSRLDQYRIAYVIAMCGFFLVGWTVHFWNATYVLFLFLLASGIWMLEAEPVKDQEAKSDSRRLSRAGRGQRHNGGVRARTTI